MPYRFTLCEDTLTLFTNALTRALEAHAEDAVNLEHAEVEYPHLVDKQDISCKILNFLGNRIRKISSGQLLKKMKCKLQIEHEAQVNTHEKMQNSLNEIKDLIDCLIDTNEINQQKLKYLRLAKHISTTRWIFEELETVINAVDAALVNSSSKILLNSFYVSNADYKYFTFHSKAEVQDFFNQFNEVKHVFDPNKLLRTSMRNRVKDLPREMAVAPAQTSAQTFAVAAQTSDTQSATAAQPMAKTSAAAGSDFLLLSAMCQQAYVPNYEMLLGKSLAQDSEFELGSSDDHIGLAHDGDSDAYESARSPFDFK